VSQSRSSRRKPRTREQLLPLSPSAVRALSLEHHMALSAVRGGHGSVDIVAILVRSINLAYLMDSAASKGGDAALFRDAERAVNCCIARIEAGNASSLTSDESAAIERVLALYDEQLASYPAFHYGDAWNRYMPLLANGKLSAISRE
jgi:hypothetical protein